MKDWAFTTSIEEMEAATNSLLETAQKVGADTWQQRVKNQTPHCGFGEAGTCCRICSMGPCRITKKAPRGICGCDVHGIVARNYLRFTVGGTAAHSDHGREIMHTLHQTREGGNYQVKDPEKLIRIAKEWGVWFLTRCCQVSAPTFCAFSSRELVAASISSMVVVNAQSFKVIPPKKKICQNPQTVFLQKGCRNTH